MIAIYETLTISASLLIFVSCWGKSSVYHNLTDHYISTGYLKDAASALQTSKAGFSISSRSICLRFCSINGLFGVASSKAWSYQLMRQMEQSGSTAVTCGKLSTEQQQQQ